MSAKPRKTYSEKLLDPRWQRKRLEILGRDGFSCRSCGSTTKTLHVHHLFYKKGAEPWDYNSGDLVTACDECHAQLEVFRSLVLARLKTVPLARRVVSVLGCFEILGPAAEESTRAFAGFLSEVIHCETADEDEFSNVSDFVSGLNNAFVWLVSMLVRAKDAAEEVAYKRAEESAALKAIDAAA